MASISLSIVVEWENVQNAALSRAERMLSAVRAQIVELPSHIARPVQVLLVYPKDGEGPAADLPDTADSTIAYLEVDGLDYYSLKNAGAAQANGDLLVFVDSDVVPDPGWLANLVGAYLKTWPAAVCGQTYLDGAGLYANAMSSFWLFPRRAALAPDGEPSAEIRFFANNLLISRQAFAARSFPETAEIRGRCAALADAILADGGSILRIPAAKVGHPPPNGLRHFLKRAMTDGHDAVARREPFSPAGLVDRYLRQGARSVRKVWRQGKSDGLNVSSLALMTAVPTGYYLAAFAGELSARVAPDWTRRIVRV